MCIQCQYSIQILGDGDSVIYKVVTFLFFLQGLHYIIITYINSTRLARINDRLYMFLQMDKQIKKQIEQSLIILKKLHLIFVVINMSYLGYMASLEYCGNKYDCCGFYIPMVIIPFCFYLTNKFTFSWCLVTFLKNTVYLF